MDKIWLTKLVVLMGKLQFVIFTEYILQWHLHIIVMHSLLYRKNLLQDFFNFHWLWLLRFLLVPSIWFYLCSCWFCASIISTLKNSAPPDAEFADQFLEGCTSIILALKKPAHHAQKCTDWFLLEHYASIHILALIKSAYQTQKVQDWILTWFVLNCNSALSLLELTIAAIRSSVFSSRQQRYLVFNSRISNINFKQIFALICLMSAPTSSAHLHVQMV